MRFIVSILIAAAAVAIAAPARADGFPRFDIDRGCKAEVAETGGTGETMASCVGDETRARDELQPRWNTYGKADQKTCVAETSMDGTPSYVELQICLEMAGPSGSR